MERGKKINIETLLNEITDVDNDKKQYLIEIFLLVYKKQGWPDDSVPTNRLALYTLIEDLLGSNQ